MNSFKYTRAQRTIHWLAAVLIIFLLVTGMAILSEMPNTADKITNLTIHAALGGLAGLLIVTRVVLRKRSAEPPAVQHQKLATLGHMALNLTILFMAISGMVLMIQSGAINAIIGDAALPDNFKDFTPRLVHGVLANVAIGLIIIHVVAALYHQFVLKDGLMLRMKG